MIKLVPIITSFGHDDRVLDEETQSKIITYVRDERKKHPANLSSDENDFINTLLSEKANYAVCAELTDFCNDWTERAASFPNVSHIDIVKEYDYLNDCMVYALLFSTAWSRPYLSDANGVRYYICDADKLDEKEYMQLNDANLFIKRKFSTKCYLRGRSACSVTHCIPIISIPMATDICGYAIGTSIQTEAHDAFEFLDMRYKDSKRLFEL